VQKTAVYPGSFDPITNGHIDVIERSLAFLDEIIIAVSVSSRKDLIFNAEERAALIKKVFKGRKKINVETFDGLLVDYMEKKDANIIIRGIRAVSDFEYEFQMAITNRELNKKIDTIFLMPGEEFFYVSSTLVKEIARLGGDVSRFVPGLVKKALKDKYKT
jgi:pantetheine-phosphate adenylyltransferase